MAAEQLNNRELLHAQLKERHSFYRVDSEVSEYVSALSRYHMNDVIAPEVYREVNSVICIKYSFLVFYSTDSLARAPIDTILSWSSTPNHITNRR